MLVDIEGTTTPVSFVYDVLFPYAAERLEAFCAKAAGQPEVAEAIQMLRHEYELEGEPLPEFDNGAAFARHLMDQDRKSTGHRNVTSTLPKPA